MSTRATKSGRSRKCRKSLAQQGRIIGRHAAGQSIREISREEHVTRETVSRILSQEEHEGLLAGYRAVVMTDLVPLAIKGARHHLRRKDRQTIIETLYGSKVLLQQHDIAVSAQVGERDYSSAMVRFHYEYGRWPTKAEAIEFDKTIPVEPLVKKVH